MKRRLIPPLAVLLMLGLFSSLDALPSVYAQSGSGALPAVKPTPTPNPKSARPAPTKPAPPAAHVTPTLAFNQEAKGRLDPKASAKGAAGSFFEEYILNARSDDWLTFRIESDDQSLGLQILDKDKAEVAVAKDSSPGGFKINTPTGALPADGEYRVRVTGAISGKNSIPYTLKVNRLGLTANVYNERFQKIYSGFRESDPASVEQTLAGLEELGKEDGARPTTFEMLGIIYLYNRQDFEKAEQAMEQAIKLNGAAVVKITFDSQWRRMARLRSGNFGFEDARTGWVRIRPGQIELSDPSNKILATVKGAQIKEMSKIVTATNNLVTITGENARRPFVFAPGTMQQAEADLVIKLVQNHVMGKSN